MKVADARTFVVGNPPPGFGGRYFVFLKLVTEDGIEGVGEVYTATFGAHTVARMVLGVDDKEEPLPDVHRIWVCRDPAVDVPTGGLARLLGAAIATQFAEGTALAVFGDTVQLAKATPICGITPHCHWVRENSKSPTSTSRSMIAPPALAPIQIRPPPRSGMWKAKPAIAGMALR